MLRTLHDSLHRAVLCNNFYLTALISVFIPVYSRITFASELDMNYAAPMQIPDTSENDRHSDTIPH